MTEQLIVEVPHHPAQQQYSLTGLKDVEVAQPLDHLFSEHDPRRTLLNQKVRFCDAAWRHLCAMDEYDCRKVLDELLFIARHPKDPQAHQHTANPLLWLRQVRAHFKRYHYNIEYYVDANNRVLVTRLWFDRRLTGIDVPVHSQRHLLYKVERSTGGDRYSEEFLKKNFESTETTIADVNAKLVTAWGSPSSVQQVNTRFAAVNGMKNDLRKATWLMGAHVDVASGDIPDAPETFNEYSLFHNPTHGKYTAWFLDVWDCARDKNPLKQALTTDNCHHLAAALRHAQRRGNKTHWVVHSRGGIVFARAVELAMAQYPKEKLACHTVSLHAIGTSVGRIERACGAAHIEIKQKRINPYDMVPNVAGPNLVAKDIPSGLLRSLLFSNIVMFGKSPLASPHTLPYLGMDTFIEQLNFSGHKRLARLADKLRPKGE